MRKFFFLYSAFLLFSCYHKINIVGKYHKKSSPIFFQFNADSTYIYWYRYFHLVEYSNGYWTKITEKKIKLNSTIQSNEIPLKITYPLDTISKPSKIELNFEGKIYLKNYKWALFINDTLYTYHLTGWMTPTKLTIKEYLLEYNALAPDFRFTTCDSIFSLRANTPIHSLVLKILKFDLSTDLISPTPIQTVKYFSPQDQAITNLNVTVCINDSLFNYQLFKNEILKVRQTGIYKFYKYRNSWVFVPKVTENNK